MSRWEHRYLGDDRFPEMLSALEIEHFFTLDQGELASVRERRGPLNRLALALQIGFLKMTGRTLNSVELIPPAILDHLGRHLDCVPPRIASVRAFYRRRRRTLFEHHEAALRLLGRTVASPHAERGLVAYLRREAAAVFDQADLVARARIWLVEHHYLVLRERDIRRLVIAARRHYEQVLFKTIAAAVPAERATWVSQLLAPVEGGRITLLANIVMAWNTHHLQAAIDLAPGDHADDILSRLAPIGHKHINMRGILTFDLTRYGSSLLHRAPQAAQDRASS